jgi:hypothetical protein
LQPCLPVVMRKHVEGDGFLICIFYCEAIENTRQIRFEAREFFGGGYFLQPCLPVVMRKHVEGDGFLICIFYCEAIENTRLIRFEAREFFGGGYFFAAMSPGCHAKACRGRRLFMEPQNQKSKMLPSVKEILYKTTQFTIASSTGFQIPKGTKPANVI